MGTCVRIAKENVLFVQSEFLQLFLAVMVRVY